MLARPSVPTKPMRIFSIGFAAGGIAMLFSVMISIVACEYGFLFGGVSLWCVVLETAVICAAVASLAAIILRCGKRHFGWLTLFVIVAVCSPTSVGILAYFDTQRQMRTLMTNLPVPEGLKVYNGESLLFASYAHFSGPPSSISSLLYAKGLLEIPEEPNDSSDANGISNKESSKVGFDWWKPTSMPGAKFYFLYHKIEGSQGWSEGWWVNGSTNEVYAFIRG